MDILLEQFRKKPKVVEPERFKIKVPLPIAQPIIKDEQENEGDKNSEND